jgi:electron transfer flavoprotein alpha subunit
MKDKKEILIFSEQVNGKISHSFYELVSKMKALYQDSQIKAKINAVLLGENNQQILEELKASGVQKIFSIEHKSLAFYHPDFYTEAILKVVDILKPEIVLMAATEIGSELAPTVAARLKTGLAAHCSDLCLDDNEDLVTIIPAFGGKMLGEILVPQARPIMASVKPGVFEKMDFPADIEVEIIAIDSCFLDELDSRIALVGTEKLPESDTSIESAEAVVCVGLGIGNQENFEKANELASLLKASICYTRPVVDLGYIDNEDAMIGTSGKMIRPKIYIGFGVSGAAHHVCGMKDSGLIININTNQKAEIFNVSNYSIVEDSGIMLDEMLKAIKNIS